MDSDSLNKVYTSIRHQNIEAAIFQLSLTQFDNKDLLLGILYYMNAEYLRAVNYLSPFSTKTSLFYTALSLMKTKNYKTASHYFDKIFFKQTLPDTDTIYKDFYITNDEYICELHAECLTQIDERYKALQRYLEAAEKAALPVSCKNLIMENRQFSLQSVSMPEKTFFDDLISYKATKSQNTLQKYNDRSEHCLFFQSEAARMQYEDGNNIDALNIFISIKIMDNLYFNNVDVYSTILWYQKDVDNLGLLCRNLVDSIPKASITWLVLGNYFSLKRDHLRSIQCFKRSIIIRPNYYAYILLGHESIIKQDYTLASKYFTQSLKQYKNNYNAFFGLGMVYTTINKIENGEYYLKKAIQANQNNLRLKYFMMSFYNCIKEYVKAIEIFCDALNCDINSIDIAVVFQKLNVDENIEMILLESINFFMYNDQEPICRYILDHVRNRGKTYCQKSKLVNKN